MVRTRRRLARSLGALAGLAVAAGLLSACQGPNANAVATTVVPPPSGCDTGRVTVIGASLDLSGPGASLGRQYLAGLELGIAKVNAGNGVPPHNSCFELVYKDNRGNAAIDTQALLDLVNVEKAGVVVGDFLGASSSAYLGSLGVSAISLSNLAVTFEPKAFPYTFPMTASMESQAFVMAREIKKAGIRRVAVVVTDDIGEPPGGRATWPPSRRPTASRSSAGQPWRPRAPVPRLRWPPCGPGAPLRWSCSTTPARWPPCCPPGRPSAGGCRRWRARTRPPQRSSRGSRAAPRGSRSSCPPGRCFGRDRGPHRRSRFRARLLAHLHTGSLRGSIIPYAETYDAMTMMGNVASGSMGVVASDVQSFLQNANYQGVLASYTYTAGAHTGVSASDQSVVPLASLSNGFLKAPASSRRTGSGA